MNKDEIKKALRCCASLSTYCIDCPYYNNGDFSCDDGKINLDALDIITKQEKEIDALKEKCELLAELEDKIMNGTLVETPCKVGDTVYCVEYFCDYKGCSSDEQMFCCGCPEMIERERRKEKFVISKKKFRLQDLDSVGKTLFPTEEAAEARLKELQEKE